MTIDFFNLKNYLQSYHYFLEIGVGKELRVYSDVQSGDYYIDVSTFEDATKECAAFTASFFIAMSSMEQSRSLIGCKSRAEEAASQYLQQIHALTDESNKKELILLIDKIAKKLMFETGHMGFMDTMQKHLVETANNSRYLSFDDLKKRQVFINNSDRIALNELEGFKKGISQCDKFFNKTETFIQKIIRKIISFFRTPSFQQEIENLIKSDSKALHLLNLSSFSMEQVVGELEQFLKQGGWFALDKPQQPNVHIKLLPNDRIEIILYSKQSFYHGTNKNEVMDINYEITINCDKSLKLDSENIKFGMKDLKFSEDVKFPEKSKLVHVLCGSGYCDMANTDRFSKPDLDLNLEDQLKFFYGNVLGSVYSILDTVYGASGYSSAERHLSDLIDFREHLISQKKYENLVEIEEIILELEEYVKNTLLKRNLSSRVARLRRTLSSDAINLENQCLLMEGGTKGHFMLNVIKKTSEDRYTFTTINTGGSAEGDILTNNKTKPKTYTNLTNEDLSEDFFEHLRSFRKGHGLEVITNESQQIYEVNNFVNRTLNKRTNAIYGAPIGKQRGGTCAIRAWSSYLHRRMTKRTGDSSLYWEYKVFYTQKYLREFREVIRKDENIAWYQQNIFPKYPLELCRFVLNNYLKIGAEVLEKRQQKLEKRYPLTEKSG